MDLEDFIVSNNILPLGSVVFVMFCVSRYGWDGKISSKRLTLARGLKFPTNVQKYMLYVIPAVVVVIYLKAIMICLVERTGCGAAVWMIVSLLVLAFVGWIIFETKRQAITFKT